MLDCFSKKTTSHLVVDQSTFGILTTSPSIAVANAVSQGLLNSSTMTVVLFGKADVVNQISKDPTVNYTLVRQMNHASSATDMNLGKIVAETANRQLFDIESSTAVSANWKDIRTLANSRQQGLMSLESKIERYLSRIKSFTADDILIPVIKQALNQSDATTENYSDLIVEWAEIAKVSNFAAYQELKMKVDTVELTVVRLHAIWTKYVDKVNQLHTHQEIMSCVNNELELELRSGSQ